MPWTRRHGVRTCSGRSGTCQRTRIWVRSCCCGKFDAWIANFERFEANCPDALPLAVQALEVCQYLGDFQKVDRYLDGLRQEAFRVENELQLADCLEVLLYLLLYFDVEQEMMLKFAQTYDVIAKRIYGKALARPAARRPGRLRIGYLSADLRDHVMGKMMWQAIVHHDKSRFELYFYSLAKESDEWTRRFQSVAHRFEVIALRHERAAATRIAKDDLDILVDLSTHTKGAKPGILAFKPARADHACRERRNGRTVCGRLQAHRPLGRLVR